ncbi:MAG: hydrogenase expression/formation protein HypE [Desulfobacterales bacterium]|nr:hydrogenase expression/formation protein HypE [Desulfobacterales bacterium]
MKFKTILLEHGGAGKSANRLLSEVIFPVFDNPILGTRNDGAVMDMGNCRIAFSTDAYVVDPIFFPGGNIGNLAINGTVNDLSMCGSTPLYLSSSLILEEGLELESLEVILQSMQSAAQKAGVQIVTGDTKVVPKSKADRIYICTAGLGIVPSHINIDCGNACPGDKIIINGDIAAHGIAILIQREGLKFDSAIESDTAALNSLVQAMLAETPTIHVLRDPTRGGISAALNDIAKQSKVGIKIKESEIPIRNDVAVVCEMLGIDPLYVANEGKLLSWVPAADAERLLSVMKTHELGKNSRIIGEVVSDFPGKVIMETRIHGTRIIDIPSGDPLPRIC